MYECGVCDKCSLSLWRMVRGSKLMHLDLIHGLFITETEFRLSTTFILMIIIMHIYNWYHSITASIHLCIRTQIIYTWHISPRLYYLPLLLAFFCSLFAPSAPLLLTWNPPCCDRIRPRCPQVARNLTLPFPSPGSYAPHSKIPTPWSFSTPNIHSLGQQCELSSQDRAQ